MEVLTLLLKHTKRDYNLLTYNNIITLLFQSIKCYFNLIISKHKRVF